MNRAGKPLKLGVAAILSICALAYAAVAARLYWADRAAERGAEHLADAVRIAPGSAEYHDLRGFDLLHRLSDSSGAIAELQTAVRLNPHNARYWLDLAGALQLAGRSEEQKAALEAALKADATTPLFRWEAANFFLARGDTRRGLHELRTVMTYDDYAEDSAIDTSWRATHNAAEVVDAALPDRARSYLAFLALLVRSGELDSAGMVWRRLAALQQPFPAPSAFPFLRLAIDRHNIPLARQAWSDLQRLSPDLRGYVESDNLIVNSGFERDLLNGGFDWCYTPVPQVTVALDANTFHEGTRSLMLAFDGEGIADAGIYQYVPVSPATVYDFSAFYKAEEVTTASGPRFVIRDAESGVNLAQSDEAIGSTPWREQRFSFTTGPATQLAVVRIGRDPAGPVIRGRFWLDDVRLTRSSR